MSKFLFNSLLKNENLICPLKIKYAKILIPTITINPTSQLIIKTERGNISIKKPLSRAKSVCIKKVNKPQINAYKVTAKNKCPEDFMSIWRITDLYKPNIEKIGIPIIGAINISLIVSSFGKYQRSKRIEYDAHKIKTNNILSVKTNINFLDNLERFDILVNIFYFHLIFL